MDGLNTQKSVAAATQPLPIVSREDPPRKPAKRITSLGLLHAHALAIEHEAESRYRELAQYMGDQGNEAVATLFSQLADFEAQHAFHWAKKSIGVEIPVIADGQYAWIDAAAPLPEARAFVYRMMTAHLALEIALRAEERAKRFFERVSAETDNEGVRELAREMAREEQSHIAWVRDALARQPAPLCPSEEQPGHPAIANEL